MANKQSNLIIGNPFTELTSVDSTNNYAMSFARQGSATHGSVWFAHHQTAGKGQRGNSWQGEPGKNIAMSVLLDTKDISLKRQFELSVAISLSVYDMLHTYIPTEIAIKWPNDIYWGDKKAVGILIENIIKGNFWQWAIAGIGLNVNQVNFPELVNPVSLALITDRTFDPIQLAKQICECLQNRYTQLFTSKFDETLEEYNSLLYKRGQKVRLLKGNIAFECIIDHVDASGMLWVKGAMQDYFSFGEIKWVI